MTTHWLQVTLYNNRTTNARYYLWKQTLLRLFTISIDTCAVCLKIKLLETMLIAQKERWNKEDQSEDVILDN